MTAKFHFMLPPPPAAPQSGPDIELEFWASVKDSTSPAVLGTYLERYPDGEFAPIARALIEHYERQLKAEVAAREQERKRLEEEKKAAEVKRLEEARRAREAALAEERWRAQEAKNAAEAKLVEEKQRAEWLARTEELKKALEEMRLAREAATTAEKQRLAAVEEAKQATKAAKETIARKREADEAAGDSTRVAALPKLEKDLAEALQRELKRLGCYRGGIDGVWGPESRSALTYFNQQAKMALPTDVPEEASLATLRMVNARVCPGAIVGAPSKLDQPVPNAPAYNPHDRSRRVTPGGSVTCGPRGCQTVPQGCHAVRGTGGGGLGGKIFCP
jgi:hypothetical protein